MADKQVFSVAPVPRAELRPGYSISRIIKGGWQLSGDHGSVERTRAIKDMVLFYDAGVTTFDCADIYTGVEEMLGEFRRSLAKMRGTTAVDNTRIHTKYVPDIEQLPTLKKTDVAAIIDRSLQRLQIQQIDLVQFHWWDYAVDGCIDALGHLQDLRSEGKIQHIGVTNFDGDHLEQLCQVTDIVSAQIQYSLLDRRPAGQFAEIARKHSVHLLSYGVLAGGFLTDRWLDTPDPGFEFSNRSLIKYRLIIEECGGWSFFQQLLQVLRQIADRHAVDIDTIALRSMLDNQDVTATIVGARYAERLPHTLRTFDVNLEEQDKTMIEDVMSRAQGPHGSVFGLERDTSGLHGRIMKYNINSGDSSQLRHTAPKSDGSTRG